MSPHPLSNFEMQRYIFKMRKDLMVFIQEIFYLK